MKKAFQEARNGITSLLQDKAFRYQLILENQVALNADEDKILKVMPATICISLIKLCLESIIESKVTSSTSECHIKHTQVPMTEFQAVSIQSFLRAFEPKALV